MEQNLTREEILEKIKKGEADYEFIASSLSKYPGLFKFMDDSVKNDATLAIIAVKGDTNNYEILGSSLMENVYFLDRLRKEIRTYLNKEHSSFDKTFEENVESMNYHNALQYIESDTIKKIKGLENTEAYRNLQQEKADLWMQSIKKILEEDKPSIQERYKKVLSYRYGFDDGIIHSLEETGEKFGVSRVRIFNIIHDVAMKIEKYEEKIDSEEDTKSL